VSGDGESLSSLSLAASDGTTNAAREISVTDAGEPEMMLPSVVSCDYHCCKWGTCFWGCNNDDYFIVLQ
jgi:hypothetical protein